MAYRWETFALSSIQSYSLASICPVQSANRVVSLATSSLYLVFTLFVESSFAMSSDIWFWNELVAVWCISRSWSRCSSSCTYPDRIVVSYDFRSVNIRLSACRLVIYYYKSFILLESRLTFSSRLSHFFRIPFNSIFSFKISSIYSSWFLFCFSRDTSKSSAASSIDFSSNSRILLLDSSSCRSFSISFYIVSKDFIFSFALSRAIFRCRISFSVISFKLGN